MDPFYAFLIFVVLLALETMARHSWLAIYYRFGIPVYHTRRAMRGAVVTNGLDALLRERFKDRPGHPTLRFKLLPSGSQPGGEPPVRIAFHEALFEARGGPRYFPVMRSLAEVDSARGEVRVTGWLNWYVLFLLFYLVYNTITDRSFLFVALLVAVLFGLSYMAQAGLNQVVAEEISAGG